MSRRAVGRGGALVALSLGAFVSPATAQTFQGRVTGQAGEGPVATALVRLVDEAGDQLAISIADSAGLYRLEAPDPGVFRIEAERVGFQPVETPLLEALNPEGVYTIDLEMVAAPVELRGFTVLTDRLPEEQADRSVQQITGLHPRSLRYPAVDFEKLQDHLGRSHTLVDVVRWEFSPAIIVYETPDGPCFSFRNMGCLPVYLNGLRLNRDFMPGIPLDMIYRMQILVPSDGSVVYGSAVLLFTEAWLR